MNVTIKKSVKYQWLIEYSLKGEKFAQVFMTSWGLSSLHLPLTRYCKKGFGDYKVRHQFKCT